MHPTDRRILEAVPSRLPAALDLTDPEHLRRVTEIAEILERTVETGPELRGADRRIAPRDDVPVMLRVALKLALGRRLFQEIEHPTHVSLVFAVYKEHLRILPASEHPAGEDLVREKLRQLRWLFGPTPRHSWDLTVVDDGCPEGSGERIQEIFDEFAEADEEVRVLFLTDAIAEGLPIVSGMTSTDDSRKGGSIRLGLWNATDTPRGATHHLAVFTDADLSTHLGQIGLLASSLADTGTLAAVGSRREEASIVVKGGTRNTRGKLFVYLWKRLLPQLDGIVDTQCGFKGFDARKLRPVLKGMRDNGFSFDIELLLRCRIGGGGTLRKVPVAWIDSEEASTTTELDPYLTMLQSVARLYRETLPATPEADAFATLIEGLDAPAFATLVAHMPEAISGREPREFEEYDGVSARQLAEIAST